MTIEELLECSADILEKMTDLELEAHFKPLLVITRPELAPKPSDSKPYSSVANPNKRPIQSDGPIAQSARQLKLDREAKAREIASKFGMDIGDLFNGK